MQASAEMLTLWASLAAPRLHSAKSWDAVDQVIAAGRSLISGDIRDLEAAVALSNRILSPLEDPFCADFGLHRWLTGGREESYSDWLQYVVRQLDRHPDLVYRLFQLDPPTGIERDIPSLSREFTMDSEIPRDRGASTF